MKRVLLVENDDGLSSLSHLLVTAGFTVDRAANGVSALEKARQSPPHLVVSELLLPVLDGYSLLRTWKEDQALQQIPFVVYATTSTDPEGKNLALELGADAFWDKPAEPETLLERLHIVSRHVESGGPLVRPPNLSTESFLARYSQILQRQLQCKIDESETTRGASGRVAEETHREEEQRARLSDKMDAIGTLASGIAHDFNNILAAILGNAELAAADPSLSKATRVAISEINSAGKRAQSLVRRILTFGRRHSTELGVVHLRPVVEETAAFLRSTLPASVELSVTIDEHAPNVFADDVELQQILVNLATNSWHSFHGNPGSIEFQLSATVLGPEVTGAPPGSPGARFAKLSIIDNGCGMDEATQRQMFDPFFTTKPQGHGTGLGLSVVHGLVGHLDGTLTVRSTPGVGTTIDILLPETTETSEEDVAPSPAPPPPEKIPHILYIDDEDALVFLAERIFQNLGYRISGFTRTEDAMAALRAAPYDFQVVLTDYNMPRASGLDVAAEVQEIRPDLPIVLLSGYVTEELREKAAAANIQHLLQKPDSMTALAAAVQGVLSTVDG